MQQSLGNLVKSTYLLFPHLFIHPLIHLTIPPSNYPPIQPSTHPPIQKSPHPPIQLSSYPPIYPSTHPSIHPSQLLEDEEYTVKRKSLAESLFGFEGNNSCNTFYYGSSFIIPYLPLLSRVELIQSRVI